MQQNSDESPQTDTGRWPAPQSGFFAPQQPFATVTRARPWLTALIAFISMLVIVAAAGNQWVTDAVGRHTQADTLGNHLARLVYSYAWRFNAPHGSDIDHFWVAGLAAVGTVLVLTLLLVAIVARGFGRFWQTLFATWFVVVVATEVAAYVRAAIIDESRLLPAGEGKAQAILFSTFSPGARDVLAGLVAGLLVGLVAAITAVASRHDVELPADTTAPEPLAGPWRQEEPYQTPPPATTNPSPWTGEPRAAETSDQPHSTAVLPNVPSGQRPPYAAPAQTPADPQPEPRAETPTDTSAESERRSSSDAPTESLAPASSGDDATAEFPRHSAPPPPEEQ